MSTKSVGSDPKPSSALVLRVGAARFGYVFLLGGIGDHLFALPLIRALRDSYKNLRLAAVSTSMVVGEYMLKKGLVDELIPVSLRPEIPMSGIGTGTTARDVVEMAYVAWRLRRTRADISIYPATGVTWRSAAWQALVGARLRFGIASHDVRNWFTDLSEFSIGMHHIDQNLVLARRLGCTVRSDVLSYYRESFAEVLSDTRKDRCVVIHPFLVTRGRDGRQWPLERFVAVGNALSDQGNRVVIVGTDSELESIGCAVSGSVVTARLTDLDASVRLLAGATLVIGNDSAVVHLASLVGTPALSVVGSTHPSYTRPYGPGGVVRLPLPCSPCFADRGYLGCPDIRCLGELSTEIVLRHPLISALLHKPDGQYSNDPELAMEIPSERGLSSRGSAQ